MALLLAILALVLPLRAGAAAIDSLVSLPGISTIDREADLLIVPNVLAMDPIGRIWALDRARGRIQTVHASQAGRSHAIEAAQEGSLPALTDIGASGSYLYLLDSARTRILLTDLDGHFRDSVELAEEVERAGIGGRILSLLLVDRSGTLSLIEPGAGQVVRLDRRGRFIDAPFESVARQDRPGRIGDARLGEGDGVVLLDPNGPSLFTLTPDGILDGVTRLDVALTEPLALAIDPEGGRHILSSDGRILVVDRNGNRVWEGEIELRERLGSHRVVITRDWVLCVASPSKGVIDRWRIARTVSSREER